MQVVCMQVVCIPDNFEMAYPAVMDMNQRTESLEAIWIMDRDKNIQIRMTPKVAKRIAEYIQSAVKENLNVAISV